MEVKEARLQVAKAEMDLAQARKRLRQERDKIKNAKQYLKEEHSRAHLAKKLDLANRRAAMLAYHRAGHTYAAVGRKFGVGGQRAAQVIRKAEREEARKADLLPTME